MSRVTRVSTPALVFRSWLQRPVAALLLGALLAGSALAISLAPGALDALADAELRSSASSLSPLRADVNATGTFGEQKWDGAPDELFAAMDDALATLPGRQSAPLDGIMGDPLWIARLRPIAVTPPTPLVGIDPSVRLSIAPDWAERARLVDGTAPSAWTGSLEDGTAPDLREPIEIAISAEAARRLSLGVGDLLGSEFGPLRVSGVFEPIDPLDPFWVHTEQVLSPLIVRQPGALDQVTASVIVDPSSSSGLRAEATFADLQAWYPTQSSALEYSELDLLGLQVNRLASLGLVLPNGQGLVIQSGLADATELVRERVGAVTAVLALAVSAPIGALLAVITLGIRTVVNGRRSLLGLASARGAGTVPLRALLALEGAVIAVPWIIIGIAGAALLSGRPLSPGDFVAPALLALIVCALFAAAPHPASAPGQRDDLGAPGRSRTRWIVEVLVVAAAAVSVFLLFQRGITPATSAAGVDPLLAVTPLLLSLAVCIAVLRVYPLPVLALQRRSRRSRGAVGLLGAARAVRDPGTGFAAVLAMLVGMSAAVFALTLGATVSHGILATARGEVGADVRVEAPALSAATLSSLEGVAGVTAVAGLREVSSVGTEFGSSAVEVTVILADTAALHAVRPDIPDLSRGSADTIAFLASSDIADRIRKDASVNGAPGVEVGTIDAHALPGVTRSWLLVDERYAADVSSNDVPVTVALLAGDEIGSDAVLAAANADAADDARVRVTDTAALVAEASARPAIAGLTLALNLLTVVSLVLALATIVIGTLGAAPARNRVVATARLLGMKDRQVRGLILWEIAPTALAATLAGALLGLGVALTIVGLIDLRDVVGGTSALRASVPWGAIAGVAVGFLVLSAIAGAVAALASNRLDAARFVRMGAE